MSDLVKTADDIYEDLCKSWKIDTEEKYDSLASSKFLVLPSGIDTLEMMLKKEVLPGEQLSCTPEYLGVEVVKIISSVFARITCFLCVGVVADGEIINV